jgi:hypothetical protein
MGSAASRRGHKATGRCSVIEITHLTKFNGFLSKRISLTRLRGFAVFQGVRSLFINKLDEKVFTTAGGCYFASGTDYAPLVGHFAVVGTLGVRS